MIPCEHSVFILSLWLDLLIGESKAGASGIPGKKLPGCDKAMVSRALELHGGAVGGGKVRELAGHEDSQPELKKWWQAALCDCKRTLLCLLCMTTETPFLHLERAGTQYVTDKVLVLDNM